MEKSLVPRVLLAGAEGGVGKSLITLGVAYELRRRGLSVSVCITNPNISLAAVYRRISGRYVRCLDPRILSSSQIIQALAQAGVGADIVLIDGTGSLYDGGSAGAFDRSDADIAALTRTPTALVMNGAAAGNSLGAALKGFIHYARGFELAGAVVNRAQREGVGDGAELKDRTFFEGVMSAMRLPHPLGVVAEAMQEFPPLPRRATEIHNLGALPRQFFLELSAIIQQSIDLDELVRIAQRAPALEGILPRPLQEGPLTRIAVTDDSCFGVCFQDNLDLMRHYGADLVGFSPLADRKLPEGINAVYLTGAYLEEYAEELAANRALHGALREFVEAGGALYAEGSASTYLCERFRSGEQYYAGVGILPTTAESQGESLSYCDGVTTCESVLGSSGLLCKGITTEHWRISREFPVLKCLQIAKPAQRSIAEGFAPSPNTLLTSGLWHWGSCPELAEGFVARVRTN
jgi:cobyrinic acid a,c-diamide synthase